MGRQSFFRVLQAAAIAAVLSTAWPAAHAQVTWTGTSSTSWSDGANWSTGSVPVSGTLVFNFNAPNQPSNSSTTGTYNLLTFLNSTLGSSLTLGGTGTLTLSPAVASGTTISNLNTTAGRTVTIGNNLVLSAAQTWSSAASANAITTISGNLSGAGNLTIAGGVASTGTQRPNFGLTGNNSSYTGTISFGSNLGVLLGGPSAMTGGQINLNSTGANLWLTGGSGTYTFGIEGPQTSGARVQLGATGIFLTGGDVYWNPNNDTNFDWSNSAAPGTSLVVQTDGSTTPNRLFLGGTSNTFTISGANKTIQAHRMTLLSALRSSNESTARTLSVTGQVLTLSSSAVAQSGTLNVSVGGNSAGSGLEISNVNQLPNGNLTLSSDGFLILNDMGSTFNRSFGTGAGQWQITGGTNPGTANLAGFAARGSNATILDSASGTSAFDRNFALGYSLRNPNGSLYADKGVTIAQNTALTNTRLVTVANNGMDRYGTSGTWAGVWNVLNEISGNLSGTGALVVLARADTSAVPIAHDIRGTLVLSGSNSWTGAPVSSAAFSRTNSGTNAYFNAGPGGFVANASYVRFGRPESLPSGAPVSGTSYIVAQDSDNQPGGLLVTGGTATVTYDLSDNYRFLLGSGRSPANTTGETLTAFGADGGKATVKGSSLLLNHAGGTNAMHSSFIVLGGAELTLGTTAEAFNLIPSFGSSGTSGSTATTYADTTATRRLFKFGPGTLVLGNVRYTDLSLSGTDKSSQFTWQIGSLAAASGVDGAVRGLSMSAANANNSNSLKGFYVQFTGGVYEIDNSDGQNGTLAATLGTAASGTNTILNFVVSENSVNYGSGGFSAFGGDVAVTLNSGAELSWGNGGFGGTALIFGSETANRVITLTNNVFLSNNTGSTRQIRVLDNSASNNDYAVLSGTLSGASSFNKTGPGLLELSAANTFTGTTTVSAGTLRLANNLALQSSILSTSGTGALAVSAGATTPTFGGLVGSTNLSQVLANYSTVTGLTFNRGTGTSTYTGAITDGAAGMTVTKSGSGIQVLGGANSYTGATTISSGTLRLGVGNLSGNISNSAGLEILQGGATTGTASGVISGTGALSMINGGTVRLSNAANTYTGKTTIASGVLEVMALANSGLNSSLGAASTNATIDLGSTTTSGTLRYVGSGASSMDRGFNLAGNGGIEANGGAALTISGTVTGSGTAFTLGGTSTALNSLAAINATSAGVTKTGPGTWRLTGNSSYNQQLRVLDGTLIVGSVADSGNSPFGSSTGTSTLPRIGNSSATSGTAALLTTGTINRGFYVESGGGSQVVVLGGTGTGLTRFESGLPVRLGRGVTLQASTGGTVSFANNWLDLADGTNPQVGFVVGSADNAGTVVLNNYLPVGATSVAVRRGTLRLDYSDEVGGPITYSTPVTVGDAGAGGTLELSGTVSQALASLSFTGVGSTVSSNGSGMLQLYNSGSTAAVNVNGTGHQISANVALDDDSTFDVGSSAALTVSGLIADGATAGRSFTKTGSGLLTLTGNNTYTGLTTVNAGTLEIGSGSTAGSIAGNIANNAAVIFNRSNNLTYAQVISGSGSVTKQGVGKLTLTGNNTFTGLTTVEQGALAVNGSLAGGLSVQAGATLMGSGTIGGDATIAGIHAPGNSPGIETFAGNLTYTGATVVWDIWGNTISLGDRGSSYDGINVSGTLDFTSLTTLTLNFGGSGTGTVNWENSFWDESREWLLYSVSGTTTNFANFQLAGEPASWIDTTGTSFSSSSRSGNSFGVVQQGSNILLQYVVVPEPATITLALIGIAASVYVVARRRS